MKKQSYVLSVLVATALVAVDHVKACTDLIITAVFDAPQQARGIELYAPCDISDLSEYGIGLSKNGAPSNGQEFKFPAGTTVAAGSFIYVANDAATFASFMLDLPDYTVSTVANNNGDDVLELFRDEVVIDAYGTIGTDGTNTAWDFKDGWAYRKDNSKPNAAFTEAQWDFSGRDALDGKLINVNFWTKQKYVPVGSFSCNVDLCNTAAPSNTPSISIAPSDAPSTSPSTSMAPSSVPSLSLAPSMTPSISSAPTKAPKATKAPSATSTKAPSATSTKAPSVKIRR
eukprot:Nitzschia sp. Nitz4//scaffold24_size164493//37517//38496//NITZ4_002313-RA/size164493-processed-gene-0.223-mRNA-1//-1//CDS//3329544069//8211//frame0